MQESGGSIRVARSVVSELGFDDFNSAMSKLFEFSENCIDSELTDEGLKEVVGGFGLYDILDGVMTGMEVAMELNSISVLFG